MFSENRRKVRVKDYSTIRSMAYWAEGMTGMFSFCLHLTARLNPHSKCHSMPPTVIRFSYTSMSRRASESICLMSLRLTRRRHTHIWNRWSRLASSTMRASHTSSRQFSHSTTDDAYRRTSRRSCRDRNVASSAQGSSRFASIVYASQRRPTLTVSSSATLYAVSVFSSRMH